MRKLIYITTLMLIVGHVFNVGAQPDQQDNNRGNGFKSRLIARARNLYEQFLESMRFVQQYADFTHQYTVPLADQEHHSSDVLSTVFNQPNDVRGQESASNSGRNTVNHADLPGFDAASHVDSDSQCNRPVSQTMK